MLIETTRLGPVDIDESRIMTFEDGLLGFPDARRFALIQTSTDPVFFWMQSLEHPDLAFVVCDPQTFVPEYEVPIRRDDAESIGLHDLGDSQVLVIVNKVNGDLTANLMGPLVVATRTLQGRQLVLSDKRYSTRHRLLSDSATDAAVKSA